MEFFFYFRYCRKYRRGLKWLSDLLYSLNTQLVTTIYKYYYTQTSGLSHVLQCVVWQRLSTSEVPLPFCSLTVPVSEPQHLLLLFWAISRLCIYSLDWNLPAYNISARTAREKHLPAVLLLMRAWLLLPWPSKGRWIITFSTADAYQCLLMIMYSVIFSFLIQSRGL
jgi:hypothetical protein